jgi:hypothetical protein
VRYRVRVTQHVDISATDTQEAYEKAAMGIGDIRYSEVENDSAQPLIDTDSIARLLDRWRGQKS